MKTNSINNPKFPSERRYKEDFFSISETRYIGFSNGKIDSFDPDLKDSAEYQRFKTTRTNFDQCTCSGTESSPWLVLTHKL